MRATAENSVCEPTGYLFGFFNGVRTTFGAAQQNLALLRRAYGATAPNGEKIKYEVYYN